MGSFGYGTNGRRETVGAKHRIDIVSISIIIAGKGLTTRKQIPLPLYPSNPYRNYKTLPLNNKGK
jgi:hypothetical protein